MDAMASGHHLPGGQRPERDADVRPDDSVARVPLDEREVPAQREHFERG